MKRSTRILAGVAFGAALVLGSLVAAEAQDGPSIGPGNQPIKVPRAADSSLTNPTFSEDHYVPVTPCRIVDTRKAIGPISNGQTRSYYVSGTTSFVSQGGKSGGCGVPTGATAISASVTAVTPQGSGYVRAWPSNLAEPTATVLNYPKNINLGTGVTLSINQSSTVGLKVKNYGGPTELVIDVLGYYDEPMGVVISPSGTQYAGTNRVTSVVRTQAGHYTVTFDRDVSGCRPIATMHGGNYYVSAGEIGTNTVFVRAWGLSGSSVPTDQDLFTTLELEC
jgi:hypothetical protein